MLQCVQDVDHRRKARYRSDTFCFVRMKNGIKHVFGPIVDLSIGGLAFSYFLDTDHDSLQPTPRKTYRLDLYQSGMTFTLSGLQVSVIYEEEQLRSHPSLNWPPRRCGVQFLGLSRDQERSLGSFLLTKRPI